MAYGRLEVYWPDGRLESYMLNDDTVSVGRADGNVVALDTDSISRYHFSLHRQGTTVTITDLESANGTYVDGVQLTSNEPHVLGDVEEILVGSLRIIFRQVDESPTMMVNPMAEETQRMEIEDKTIHVEIDYKHLLVWPAASSSTELSVTNVGDEIETYSIQVSGLPNGWLRLTRSELVLEPSETAYVLLNVKPPRRPNTVPQKYQVSVEVTPNNHPSQVVHQLIDVEIKAYSGFGIAVGQQIDDGEPIPVFLHNQGSGVMRFTLSAKSVNNALKFQLPKAPLELQPGQRLRVDLGVAGTSPPLLGSSKTYPFVVQVQSHDASRFIAASDAEASIAPRIPMWSALTAVGITASILAIALLAVLGLLNPPEPIINSLAVDSERVAQGEALTLTIDAENAESFDVLVNNIVVENDISGDDTTVTLDTTEWSGQLNIEVIARNDSRTIRSTTSSFIYAPLAVNSFEVTPNPLIRNTVNTLTISWDVAGAEFVRITGLSDFTNNLVQSSTEYVGTYTLEGIGGIPTEALNLTLYAEDEVEDSLEVSLTVALVDPQCTALSDITLYEGPDERYQAVGTIPSDLSVVVLAQDADAGWLRVQLPDEIRGWGARDSFNCADNFRLSDLRTEINVPELPTEIPVVPTSIETTPAPVPTTPSRNNTGN